MSALGEYRCSSIVIFAVCRYVRACSGILVVTKRANPAPLPESFHYRLSSLQTLSNLDAIVPVLNINELDHWLDIDNATSKFVDIEGLFQQ